MNPSGGIGTSSQFSISISRPYRQSVQLENPSFCAFLFFWCLSELFHNIALMLHRQMHLDQDVTPAVPTRTSCTFKTEYVQTRQTHKTDYGHHLTFSMAATVVVDVDKFLGAGSNSDGSHTLFDFVPPFLPFPFFVLRSGASRARCGP